MPGRWRKLCAVLGLSLPIFLLSIPGSRAQLPAQPEVVASAEPAVPKGVEVLARGPVHEAFASLADSAPPSVQVKKKPPDALEEMPPDEKPEGDVVWIGGYWAWDDDRTDFLWVSGIWRVPPPEKRWVAGYWREQGDEWQWVPGFWTAAKEARAEITYLPQPPAAPEVAPPGAAPNPDSFYVPGHWVWTGTTYAWRAGYWAKVQSGYVWVNSHYRWTPSGYVYIPGYWDLDVATRGVLYAPVIVDPAVVRVGFVYTPTYCLSDTVVVDTLFVRPSYCHYYFGDYYGVSYSRVGFVSCAVYSQRSYDGIFVYERYRYRDVPNWHQTQINIVFARNEGRAPRPPRTLVQQNTVVQNNVTVINKNVVKNNVNNTVVNNNVNNNANNFNMLTTTKKLSQTKPGFKTVALDSKTKQEAKQQSTSFRELANQRGKAERAQGGVPTRPRTAQLDVPQAKPVVTPNERATRPPARALHQGGKPDPSPGGKHTPAQKDQGQPRPHNPGVKPNHTPQQPRIDPRTPPTGPRNPPGPGPGSRQQPGAGGPPRKPDTPPTRPVPPPRDKKQPDEKDKDKRKPR